MFVLTKKHTHIALSFGSRVESNASFSAISHVYRTPYFFIISSGTSPINDPFYLIVYIYICGLVVMVIWSVDGRDVYCSGPPTIYRMWSSWVVSIIDGSDATAFAKRSPAKRTRVMCRPRRCTFYCDPRRPGRSWTDANWPRSRWRCERKSPQSLGL